MPKTTVSTKGQVVIPREIRQHYGWGAGTQLEVEEFEDGVIFREIRAFPVTRIEDLIGCLDYSGPSKTLEEMEKAVARGARDHR